MTRIERIELELAELRRRLDAIEGRRDDALRSISFEDLLRAAECGDKLTIARYWEEQGYGPPTRAKKK